MQFLNFYSTLKQRNKRLKVFPDLYASLEPDVTRLYQYTRVCTFMHEEILAL